MRERIKFYFQSGITTFVILFLFGYAYFESYEYLKGPQLSIKYPTNGEVSNDNKIELIGNAQNISALSLNGRPIYVDKNGNFNENLLLLNGYNKIAIAAHDRFGRSTSKIIDIVVSGKENLAEISSIDASALLGPGATESSTSSRTD